MGTLRFGLRVIQDAGGAMNRVRRRIRLSRTPYASRYRRIGMTSGLEGPAADASALTPWPYVRRSAIKWRNRGRHRRRGPRHLAAERNPQNEPKTGPYDRSPVPSRLREAAHTCEFREVLQRGPKIAACLAERGGFEPPSPFSLWAAENSASSAHYFAKLLRNLSQRIYSPSVRHLSNLTGSPQWR